MKLCDFKGLSFLCLCTCLLGNTVVNAATVSDNDIGNSRFTLSDEFTWLRNRDVKGIETARIRSEQYLISARYRIGDRTTLFGKAGMANMELHRFEGETHSFSERLAYGAGMNYRIISSPLNRVEIACQYLAFEPGSGKLTGAAAMPEHQTPHEVEIDWTEWLASLKIARKLQHFTVYGGPKYSHVKCNQERIWASGKTEEETFKSEKDFGLFAGISTDINPGLSCYLEVRFIDETAYTLGFGYHF